MGLQQWPATIVVGKWQEEEQERRVLRQEQIWEDNLELEVDERIAKEIWQQILKSEFRNQQCEKWAEEWINQPPFD